MQKLKIGGIVVWQVETPCGIADCTFVDPTKPVKVGCIC